MLLTKQQLELLKSITELFLTGDLVDYEREAKAKNDDKLMQSCFVTRQDCLDILNEIGKELERN
jgi:hypothetical protein